MNGVPLMVVARWWINVASAVSLIESSQKIGRSYHRHRPGRDIFSRRAAGTLWSRYCSLRGNLLLRPVELGSVDPHAVQNDGELAGDGGLSEPSSLGEPHPLDLTELPVPFDARQKPLRLTDRVPGRLNLLVQLRNLVPGVINQT
jgi:hypothetical protein